MNDNQGEVMVVDRTTYEDLVTYRKMECTILCGYYFDSGRNKRIGEVIDYVFKERLRLKSLKNPMQEIYKLVMNSSYGKNSQKTSEKRVIYCDTDEMKVKTRTLYHLITSIDHISDNLHRIEHYIEVDRSYNRVHIGGGIVSMAKRIMNEVIAILDEIGYPPLYTDTDSMHIHHECIPLLRKRYMEVYGRELDGDKLGQFNSDFKPLVPGGKIPYATESIFLGKKSHCDVLEDEDGNKGVHYK